MGLVRCHIVWWNVCVICHGVLECSCFVAVSQSMSNHQSRGLEIMPLVLFRAWKWCPGTDHSLLHVELRSQEDTGSGRGGSSLLGFQGWSRSVWIVGSLVRLACLVVGSGVWRNPRRVVRMWSKWSDRLSLWAAWRISSLSCGLVSRETSPCCIDWKWWCKSSWHCGLVSQLRVKTMLAPRYFRANEAAPMPSKKLRWRIGLWRMCVLSSCWMRGISGGAVPTPSCPYCHCCWGLPFLPPLPFCFPFGFW